MSFRNEASLRKEISAEISQAAQRDAKKLIARLNEIEPELMTPAQAKNKLRYFKKKYERFLKPNPSGNDLPIRARTLERLAKTKGKTPVNFNRVVAETIEDALNSPALSKDLVDFKLGREPGDKTTGRFIEVNPADFNF